MSELRDLEAGLRNESVMALYLKTTPPATVAEHIRELREQAARSGELRDIFAAKAMAALIALGDKETNIQLDPLVNAAFDIADAMLARRDA